MGSKQGGQSVWMIFFMWSAYNAWFFPKKYCNAPKELGLLQSVRIVDQNAPLTNRIKLSGKGAGEIKRRCSLREKYNIGPFFLKLPASSTPPFCVAVFSFPLHPHPLSSVNRITIRLPPRISVKLENSSPRRPCTSQKNTPGQDWGLLGNHVLSIMRTV